LKQTVDYDQGFVTTKLGCLGIKVWVFTNFAPLKGKSKGRFECLKRITEKGEYIMDSDTEPTKAQWTLPQGGGKSKEPENSQTFVRHAWSSYHGSKALYVAYHGCFITNLFFIKAI
jgi:hypothetical protein